MSASAKTKRWLHLDKKTVRRPQDSHDSTAMEVLRSAVSCFNTCSESLLDRYSVTELLTIYDALCRSEWDFYPDQWTERQLREAIKLGRAPTWDEHENPTYASPEKK